MKLSRYAFFKWSKSILLVVVFMLAFCSVLCGYMIFLLRRNTIQMSNDLTQYIQCNIDSKLTDLYKYSSTLELNPTNRYLRKLKSAPEEISSEAYQFGDLMLNYKYSNKLIRSAFIYYPHIQQIVGDLGCYPADSYYALDNGLTSDGYEEWINGIIRESSSDFIYLHSNTHTQFCYVRKMQNEGEPVGYQVFELNPDELLNTSLMKESPTVLHSSMGIMLDGELVAHTGPEEHLLQLSERLPETMDTPVILEESGSLLYARPSSLSSLRYLNVYFHKKNLRPVYIALGICILGLIVCGILGATISFHIGKKHAKPLLNLLRKVGGVPDDSTDEYQTINDRIDQLIQHTYESQERVQNQQSLLSSFFLQLVLCGDMHGEYAIFNAAKRCDIIFENPRYLVAIAESVPAQPILAEDNLLKVNEYCEEHGYNVISSFYEGNLVMLFNLEETATQNEVSEFTKQLKQDLLGNETWRIALGMDYDGLVNIQCSYAQAATALHYGLDSDACVFCYNNYMERIPGVSLTYIDMFETFMLNMIQGDYEAALVLVPSVFENYFAVNDSSEITRVKSRAIQNLLLDAKQKAKKDGQKPGSSIHTARILSCPSPIQLREYTECILKELAVPDNSHKGSSSNTAEKTKDIIHRDFTNPMLGLYLISAELHVSDSYLSTTFKNAFGIGVVQYINFLRIEQAKNLIHNTDLSIREIAQAVGFSSDASFIRVFKRYEMQTPSTLRKNRKDD